MMSRGQLTVSATSPKESQLWCPCCARVRVHRHVSGVPSGAGPLRDVFAGLEVAQGPDDPLGFARTRRCECSAEWVSVEVPGYFLYQLLEERRLYHEAKQVAQAVLDRARAVERSARGLAAGHEESTRLLETSIVEAEEMMEGLSARSDHYFLR